MIYAHYLSKQPCKKVEQVGKWFGYVMINYYLRSCIQVVYRLIIVQM